MFPFIIAGILTACGFSSTEKVGVQPWCTLDKVTGRVECNYESEEACETYRQSNEYCVQNPQPNNDDYMVFNSDGSGK